MTKETMIWQTLSMIIAGMVRRNDVPDTVELFENYVVDQALQMLDFPRNEVLLILQTTDVTGFSDKLNELLTTGE